MRKSEIMSSRALRVLFSLVALLLALRINAWADDQRQCAFAVSPDGKRIAYTAPDYDQYGDSATAIWVADIDGSDTKRLGIGEQECKAQWCGNNAAAAVQPLGNTFRVYPISGGDPRVVSIPNTYRALYPVLSPDGSRVAFCAWLPDEKKAGAFVMEISTGKVTSLATETVKSAICWSPDSKRVAFGVGDYQAKYDLKIVDIESGEVTDTGINGVGVAFSSDGKSIAYTGNAVKGGSWLEGVPTDGRLMRTDLATKETIPLSDSGYNQYEEESKHWETRGALCPLWSPDGAKIAYRKIHSVRDDNKLTTNEDEIWVVNSDGTGRQKLFGQATPFAWAPNSAGVLVTFKDRIVRVALNSSAPVNLLKLPAATPPSAATQATGEMNAPGVTVSYSGIDPAYAKAIAKLASEARAIYAGHFGFNMPEHVNIEVKKDPNAKTNLWNDGDSNIFLTVRASADLAPPAKSGYFNIYGICHELGHIAMYRNIINIGLPAGVAEGWPHYAGSIVVDEVWKKLGRDLWPEPYDYIEIDGTTRLEKQSRDDAATDSPVDKFALTLFKLGKAHGTDKVMASMNAAFAGRPYGKDVVKRFIDELIKRTGDQSAGASMPPDMLTSTVDWRVSDRQITDKAVEGQVQEKDDTGIILRYDDGKPDDKRSTAGSGHAVMFKAPAGNWAVDSIQIYGSRYGSKEPPNENFSIFVCDANFDVVKTIDKPYSDLGGYDEGWRKLGFQPVKIPEGFYICVYFSPTYNKGFYMNYDTNVAKSHSKAALPWTFVHDVNGAYDWMIRPHLTGSH